MRLHPKILTAAGEALLWFIPAFVVWFVLLRPVLLPSLTAIVGVFADIAFAHIEPEILLANINDWHVKTRVVAEEATAERAMIKNIVVSSIQLGLFALPYFWATAMAIRYKRAKNMLTGTLILTVLIAGLGCFQLTTDIWLALSKSDYGVYHADLSIKTFEAFNSEVAALCKQIAGFLTYILVCVVPAALTYKLNTRYFKEHQL